MQESVRDDDLDLQELFSVLVKRKWLILIITFVFSMGGGIYAFSMTPVYMGNAMLEIGEVIVPADNLRHDNTYAPILDNAEDLAKILERITPVKADAPRGTVRLLKLTYSNTNREMIRAELEQVVAYVLERHRIKAALYKTALSKIDMTKLVGKVQVGTEPIKPQKEKILIVSMIGGVVFSVFLVFFLEFVANKRLKKEE